MSMSKKELIPGDGKFRRNSVPQNIILTLLKLLNTPYRRKKIFLVDAIVRGRLTTPNGALAVLRG